MVTFVKSLSLTLAAGALGLAALPAFAGGLAKPVVEAPVIAPMAPAPAIANGDWTGGWAGMSFGGVRADETNGPTKSSGLIGVRGGYDYDFGRYVLGGSVGYDKTDVGLGVGTDKLKDIARVSVRGGVDLGQTLVYGTVGAARASAELGGVSHHDTGWSAGIGADYRLNDRWTVGGEVLQNEFNNFGGSGTDIKATTAAINVGLRF